jgi:hypothetical protein
MDLIQQIPSALCMERRECLHREFAMVVAVKLKGISAKKETVANRFSLARGWS